MELFKNTNFDFLGKKWPFIIASLVLTVAGLASILLQGGVKYGIDFKGGALMTVKFADKPNRREDPLRRERQDPGREHGPELHRIATPRTRSRSAPR